MKKRVSIIFLLIFINISVFAEVGAGYYFRFNNFKLSIDFNEYALNAYAGGARGYKAIGDNTTIKPKSNENIAILLSFTIFSNSERTNFSKFFSFL